MDFLLFINFLRYKINFNESFLIIYEMLLEKNIYFWLKYSVF